MLRLLWRNLVVAVCAATCLAGCPGLPSSQLESVPSAPGSPTGRAGAAGGSPSVVGGSSAQSIDPLASQFPGCSEPPQADAWRAQLMTLVNRERTAQGLNPLTESPVLQRQAEQYACEMITYRFFDHRNPVTGSTLGERTEQFGYAFQVVGENLAAGQTSPQQVFNDWMNSPGHRANILDPRFLELGIGIRSGGDYHIYWVQEFGRPARP